MTDTGQDIEVPDEMFLSELIALEADTQGRFSFIVDPSAWFAMCTWVNYYKQSGKRVKVPVRECWKLNKQQTKKVLIK